MVHRGLLLKRGEVEGVEGRKRSGVIVCTPAFKGSTARYPRVARRVAPQLA